MNGVCSVRANASVSAREKLLQWFIYRCEMWKLMCLNTTCYYIRCFCSSYTHKLSFSSRFSSPIALHIFISTASAHIFYNAFESRHVAVDSAQIMFRILQYVYLIFHFTSISIDSPSFCFIFFFQFFFLFGDSLFFILLSFLLHFFFLH